MDDLLIFNVIDIKPGMKVKEGKNHEAGNTQTILNIAIKNSAVTSVMLLCTEKKNSLLCVPLDPNDTFLYIHVLKTLQPPNVNDICLSLILYKVHTPQI